MDFGGFRKAEFNMDVVCVEEISLIMLSEMEVKRGIGKDAAGSEELKLEADEVPTAEEEDHDNEEEACDAE